MPDKKISQLTAVSAPLAGTEVLPIVQSGATKKVTALELTGVNVTSDGRVGVGGVPDTTVNGSPITAKFGVHQDGGSTSYPVVGAVKYSDVTSTAGVTICGARGRGSKATPTAVADGDLLSSHIAAGYDGTDFAISSRINYEVDGTPGNDDMPGRIVFLTAADGSQTPTERMRVDSAGNTTIANGNLVIGTSGKGIDFSATPGTGTSELLADYEEGTLTATLTPATSGTITLANNTLSYTKVGRLVTINGYIEVSSVASPVGAFVTMPLPFATSSSNSQKASGAVNFGFSLIVYDTVDNSASVRLRVNASTIVSLNYFFFSFSYIAT